jgi:hypothetical protein
MERKAAASHKKCQVIEEKYRNLKSKYTALQHDMEVLVMKMEEEKTLEAEAFNIRHTEQR